MKLYIDTSDGEEIIVGLDSKRYNTNAREEKSQRLLSFIKEVLKEESVDINEITEIEVNTGPGSFTGLRVGVTVANTMGWVLGIQVNGKDLSSSESVDINYE